MDISDIDVSFGSDNEPQDEYLTEILGKAYRGDIDCCNAIMPLSFVVPFSDFKPEISDKYNKYFIDQYNDYKPPALYVYEKDGKFIMSDDYAAYYMYKEVKSEIAICVVVGPHTITEDVEYGPDYKLPLPTIDPI